MNLRGQKGFTLIEVVAAAALIGIMATMLMPSLSGANDKVKNAKLSNDLTAVDQAIQMYRLDTGKVPTALTELDSNYLGGKLEFKDATGEEMTYNPGRRCNL
ncbi:MAG: type II secretion system protein [Phascolarctobacterium sp.]